MKKNIEITGTLKMESQKNIVVVLFINGGKIDWFNLDCDEESINTEISDTFGTILGVDRNDYSDYMQLIKDLGLEIPVKWKKHWTPAENQKFYTIDMFGDIQDSRFSNCDFSTKLLKSYNIFPSRELAEKAVNLSKLERMILLWQYANGFLFEPDWLDGIQQKYYVIHDSRDENACYDYNFRQKSKNIYFEKREHVKAFIDMYEAEIKELMNIK